MPMALEGIRVLDWTLQQQGPATSMILGDLGADVIKLEDPKGENGRNYMTARPYLHSDRNFYFECHNRNKRGIILDLKKEEARQILYQLVKKSDVFVQNYRKGVAARLGVDYPTLCKYNPKLIYASATAFGPEGPESDKPGLDITGLARSGIMLAMGHPDWPPVAPQGGLADQVGAIMLAEGILAALIARDRFGIGQEVHSSLLGSITFAQALVWMSHLILGEAKELPYERRDRRNARIALLNWYECADGKWLVLCMTHPTRYWHDFCQIMGIEELENDPRFATQEKRGENNRELIAILDKVFASKPRSEWLKKLGENEDLLFSHVNTIPEATRDPQILLNKYIVDFDHPVWGKVKEVGYPVAFSKTPTSIRREAPMHGQHTEEVLREVLGYTQKDIEKLKDKGIISKRDRGTAV